jgi:hypothetical protein
MTVGITEPLLLLFGLYFKDFRWISIPYFQIQQDYQWLTPILLTTWGVEIEKIVVQGQPGQIIQETPSPK